MEEGDGMNYIEELVNTLSKLGPEMFCIVACIAAGYVIRLIPVISNKWIPPVCILIAPCIYPFLTSFSRVSPDAVDPRMRIILTGLVLGVMAFILHDKVIAKIEDKIPGFGKALKQSDDTKFLRKSDIQPPPTEEKPQEPKP